MSEASRPTSRWSSSVSTRVKSTSSSINTTKPISAPRKNNFSRLPTNNQPTFSQRMANTKHDVEELFKLYYANNIKFDTFQRQIVTGTRIPSPRTSPLISNQFTNSSTNIFNSKHCVSREPFSPDDTLSTDGEIITNESKPLPVKRTVQVRIDHNPTLSLSTSPPPPFTSGSICSTTPENPPATRHDEFTESSFVKSLAFLEEMSTDALEHNNTKKNKSTNPQHSSSSKALLASLSSIPPSAFSFGNNRKDASNISYSSFSTVNSTQQQQNQPHIITGTAVTVRQRSSVKPAWHRLRANSNIPPSTNSNSHQPNNNKTSSSPVKCDTPELPVYIGTQRVVSIPSKCSRYVLVTFPRVPVRYNAPTYVERLLLPERFPTLFQNIVHSYEHNRNNK